jgi:hypothetical protein
MLRIIVLPTAWTGATAAISGFCSAATCIGDNAKIFAQVRRVAAAFGAVGEALAAAPRAVTIAAARLAMTMANFRLTCKFGVALCCASQKYPAANAEPRLGLVPLLWQRLVRRHDARHEPRRRHQCGEPHR